MMSDIQKDSRVLAEGYTVTGTVLFMTHTDNGLVAKVLHDDGFENYYRLEQLSLDENAKPIQYRRT